MADTTKPAEVPKETPAETTEAAPAATETPIAPAAEAATEAPAAETAAEPAAAENTEAATGAEETKKEEEVKPIEEGSVEHKSSGFPNRFLAKKQYLWFGSDAVDVKELQSYMKAEKVTETAHQVAAWASETGKGLLFYGEKKGKTHGIFNLSEIEEPATEGSNKFVLTAKGGHKHTFKAPTATDRDSWVTQIKAKIAEAKELATVVAESETYKKTLESLNPPKKEEKAVEAPATTEAAPTAEEAQAEASKDAEEAKSEDKAEEAKPEEKKEEKKERRSGSRKRTSIFGNLLGKKEEKKVEEPAPAETAEEAKPEEAKPEEASAEAAPAEDAPKTEVAAAEAGPAEEKKDEEAKPEEKKEERSAVSKRTSVFSGFFKKKTHEPEAKAEEPAKDTEPVASTAPEIPPVETSTPLSADVTSPATAPTETTETAPATNGDGTKKEMKSDKRKSSLPFNFGKKHPEEKGEKGEETEKVKSPTSAFSKLRATIKGKKPEKTEKKDETSEEAPKIEETVEEKKDESKPEEEAKAEEPEAPAEKTEKPADTTPAPVAAAAA